MELVIVLVVVLGSMILHELAHGVVAYCLGDDTAKEEGRLTLNPVKHIAPVLSILVPVMLYMSGAPIFGGAKPVPVDSRNLRHGVWGMALVAIAGPLTNFLIAIVVAVIGHATGVLMLDSGTLMYMPGMMGEIMVNLVYINLGFGIFNLIPIPPLDGSRVLYALMPDEIRGMMERMERWGIVLVMIVVIVAKTLMFGDPVGGWPSMICVILFVGGVQLLALGVIGQYLAKTYLETKGRPVYIVRKTSED